MRYNVYMKDYGSRVISKVVDGDKIVYEVGLPRFSEVIFLRIIKEDDDAETADVFLQYAVFGEVIYG